MVRDPNRLHLRLIGESFFSNALLLSMEFTTDTLFNIKVLKQSTIVYAGFLMYILSSKSTKYIDEFNNIVQSFWFRLLRLTIVIITGDYLNHMYTSCLI